MNLVQVISNFFHSLDESTQNNLLAGTGTLVTLYSLYKIEVKIRAWLLGGPFLSLFLLVALLVLLTWVFVSRDQFFEFFKNVNVNQIKQMTADNVLVLLAFVLMIGCFFLVKKQHHQPITLDVRETGAQLFSIADLKKYDTKFYLADNFTQLTDEFNANLQTLIKQLGKKLSQRKWFFSVFSLRF